MRVGMVRLEGKRPPHHVDRHVVVAGLAGKHAQKMQAFDVARIDGANLAVKPLGLDQPASPVVRERSCKFFRDFV